MLQLQSHGDNDVAPLDAHFRETSASHMVLVWITTFFLIRLFQLCNKCGLFERTHGVPRPKAFPRRRRHRSRTSSTDQSVTRARSNSDEHCTTSSPYTSYTSSPETLYTSRPYTSNTSQFPDVFNAVDGATTSQDTPWMTRDIRRLSPTPSHLSSSHSATAEQPVDYHTDFQFLSYTVPS